MKEVSFKDRVPKYPGRVILTPVQGKNNTYDMVRADEPTEPGTPIDRATFESIIKSRLTGRYYPLTVGRKTASAQTSTTDLLDSGTWTVDSSGLVAQRSNYKIEASSCINSTYSVEKSVDGDESTNWGSLDGTTHTFTITLPLAIELKKIKLSLGRTQSSYSYTVTVQGSTNKSAWTDLLTINTMPSTLTEYTLTRTGDYQYYRLYFVRGGSSRVYINSVKFSEYAVNTYDNYFVASDDMPTTWDVGQKVTIQAPTFQTYALSSNYFNNVLCNTLLQSGQRYELRYNGASFDAKGV